jgi:hypothetical protein
VSPQTPLRKPRPLKGCPPPKVQVVKIKKIAKSRSSLSKHGQIKARQKINNKRINQRLFLAVGLHVFR